MIPVHFSGNFRINNRVMTIPKENPGRFIKTESTDQWRYAQRVAQKTIIDAGIEAVAKVSQERQEGWFGYYRVLTVPDEVDTKVEMAFVMAGIEYTKLPGS